MHLEREPLTMLQGSVIANRLSADPNATVLLIEAGGNQHDFFDSRVPFLAPELQMTAADWNYTTAPQIGYNNRSIPFTRGHVLGGSSSVNYMAYNRASNDTYDRWAEITGDDAWSWEKLEPYYFRNSHLVPPAGYPSYSTDVIPSAHGYGPVDVSVPDNPYPLDYHVINASLDMGGRFEYNRELNAGDFVGFSWAQLAVANGERDSAATAYLDPLLNGTVKGRRLDVLLNTQVTRLVQSGVESGVPAFRTVEMVASSSNSTICVTARKEVILSGGVVGTPQILLRTISPRHPKHRRPPLRRQESYRPSPQRLVLHRQAEHHLGSDPTKLHHNGASYRPMERHSRRSSRRHSIQHLCIHAPPRERHHLLESTRPGRRSSVQ
jgi:choline dehydrogenase-like flavoprotein